MNGWSIVAQKMKKAVSSLIMGKRIAVFTATLIAIAVALGLAVQEAPLRSESDPSIMTDAHFERVEVAARLACECERNGGDACYSEYYALTTDYPMSGDMDSGAPYYTGVDIFETDSGPKAITRFYIAGGSDADFALCSYSEADLYEDEINAAYASGVEYSEAVAQGEIAVRDYLARAASEDSGVE